MNIKIIGFNILMLLLVLTASTILSSCVLTKFVTVPMRVGGAIVSIVPVGGNTIHDAIDESAEIIDEMPF